MRLVPLGASAAITMLGATPAEAAATIPSPLKNDLLCILSLLLFLD